MPKIPTGTHNLHTNMDSFGKRESLNLLFLFHAMPLENVYTETQMGFAQSASFNSS